MSWCGRLRRWRYANTLSGGVSVRPSRPTPPVAAHLTLSRPPDRCRELAVEDHCSRVGACAHRISDATGGSALDCDLARREDARHGGRATPRSSQPRSSTRRYGGYRRPAERASRLGGGGRARQGYSPRGRDTAAAPESDVGPPLLPHGPGVVPVSVTHSLDDFAPLPLRLGLGPDGGVPKVRP